jgi:two-component system alkaline phosphatase synthesis response regulator PhoP
MGTVSSLSAQNSLKTNVNILIVEDDAPLAKMLAYLLTRAGCDVMVAHTGIEGMQLAQEIQFSLITLDIDLPDLNGLDICKELQQRHYTRHTPIIFISGRPLEADIRSGLEAGAVDYITKPFSVSEFVSRILLHVRVQNDPAGYINSAKA